MTLNNIRLKIGIRKGSSITHQHLSGEITLAINLAVESEESTHEYEHEKGMIDLSPELVLKQNRPYSNRHGVLHAYIQVFMFGSQSRIMCLCFWTQLRVPPFQWKASSSQTHSLPFSTPKRRRSKACIWNGTGRTSYNSCLHSRSGVSCTSHSKTTVGRYMGITCK
jgi:hypothetical protein